VSESEHFHNLWRGGIERRLAPGVTARIFPGEHVMLSVVTLEPHAVSPVHAHPQEQWGVCLEGEWIRIQDGVEHHVRAGDFWRTPPNVPHGGRALDRRCVILDIFAPPRDEYRRPGQGLGAAPAPGAGASAGEAPGAPAELPRSGDPPGAERRPCLQPRGASSAPPGTGA
jgi:quercetin dioxygenase-like cupin family protein